MSSLNDKLVKQLSRDEGRKGHAYPDSRGYLTIGVGHLVDERLGGSLAPEVIDLQLTLDLQEKARQVLHFLPWSSFLDEARLGVLINMCFNLGIEGLLGFPKMLKAMQAGEWSLAAFELADPNYVAQVGDRARRLAKQLLTGEWQ